MKTKPLTNKSGNARTPTREEAKRFRPAREVDPDLVAAYRSGKITMPDGRKVGRPAGSDKTPIALRVDNDVLAFFKSRGAGWQTRMNTALRAVFEAAGGK